MEKADNTDTGAAPAAHARWEDAYDVKLSPWKWALVICAAGIIVVLPSFGLINFASDSMEEVRSERIEEMGQRDQARTISELKAENRRLRTAAHPDYDPDRENEQLLMPFDGMNPCSLDDYGAASATSWPEHPERGLGCEYTRNGATTLIVTIGAGSNEGSMEAMDHDGVAGYFTVSNAGTRTLYFWAPGSEDEAMHASGRAVMTLRPF